MKLLFAVLFEDGVLCLIPGNVDECERLAHKVLVSVSQPLTWQQEQRCRPQVLLLDLYDGRHSPRSPTPAVLLISSDGDSESSISIRPFWQKPSWDGRWEIGRIL